MPVLTFDGVGRIFGDVESETDLFATLTVDVSDDHLLEDDLDGFRTVAGEVSSVEITYIGEGVSDEIAGTSFASIVEAETQGDIEARFGTFAYREFLADPETATLSFSLTTRTDETFERTALFFVLDGPPLSAQEIFNAQAANQISSGPFERGTPFSLASSPYAQVPPEPVIDNGSDGDDTILGGDVNDTLSGGAGNDDIDAGAGDDQISAGEGNDTVDAGEGDDEIAAGPGLDVIEGGPGDDNIGGGTEGDSIFGNEGNDTIGSGLGDDTSDGGAGNDIVNGGGGDDELIGGEGNDTMGASFGTDTVLGNAGDDSLGGGTGKDLLLGEDGNDAIGGGEGDDTVRGGEGDDFLAGGGRDDLIFGGAGTDRINGGTGDDVMIGDEGADLFIFNIINDGEVDIIGDWTNSEDRLRFSGSDVASREAAVDAAEAVEDGVLLTISGHTILLRDADINDIGIEDFVLI